MAQSPYTTRDILDMIEANGGPEGLNLSFRDLRGIDLSWQTIRAELERVRKYGPPGPDPVWVSDVWTLGINLHRADLFGADLQGADLTRANLQGALLEHANLQEASLWGANLQGADLSFAILHRADLWGAKLQGAGLTRAGLQGANLGNANLQGAILLNANLQKAELERADLQGAELCDFDLQGASLEFAYLQGADLRRANLQGAKLWSANLSQVNLLDCASLEGVYLHHATLNRTQLTKDKIGEAVGEELDKEYDRARETYRALKVNFVQIGYYPDAAWAYVKERKMERATLCPLRAAEYYAEEWSSKTNWWQQGWFFWVYFGKWVWAGLIDAVTGYGQQISNVLRTSAVITVLWSALYWFFGGIGDDHKPRSFCWQDFHRCLNHSVATFANLTYSSLEPKTQVAQWLTNAEALLGIGMLALLMFVIGNRVGGI